MTRNPRSVAIQAMDAYIRWQDKLKQAWDEGDACDWSNETHTIVTTLQVEFDCQVRAYKACRKNVN